MTPEELAALEARQAAKPADSRTLTDVGIAYYNARQYSRARDVLTAALALDHESSVAAIHLGLAEEGLGNLDAALAAYRGALARKLAAAERREVEARILVVVRARLALEARRAVAAENALAAAEPAPNTIAVLPWSWLGADPELKPLEVGLAHLVVTDLSKVGRFTLLERERAQALADELGLDAAGRVEPSTAARSGRLLRASLVVQGAIREAGSGIRLDASAVRTTSAAVAATGSASDRLSELFASEKRVVFALLDGLGVTLSPAERRAIEERPTADLQAFLAFSRGLDALDHGRFDEASMQFGRAAAQDPGFGAARARAADSKRLGAAEKRSPANLSDLVVRLGPDVRGDIRTTTVSSVQLHAALQAVAPSLAGRLKRAGGALPVTLKSRLAEALKQDDTSKLRDLGVITVTIPRP